MTTQPICPCDDGPAQPRILTNPPGLAVINYRIGDFVSFRHALLLSRPGELNLRDWRPGASGDLAVQMIEWWAYICDVLTFYNWRIFTNALLGTADEPESVNRIVRLLGYRPRPGLGSTGLVGFVVDGSKPVQVPQGFQLLSKPKPGESPQTFETDSAVTLVSPTDIVALPQSAGSLLDADGAVTLVGSRDSIKPGEWLLLAERTSAPNTAWLKVSSVEHTSDSLGAPLTRVSFETPPTLSSAMANDYQLLRGLQSMPFWHFGDTKPPSSGTVNTQSILHCTSLARPSNTGDIVVVRVDGAAAQVTAITSSSDEVWYRNDKDTPDKAPDPTAIPLVVLHSRLEVSPSVNAAWDSTGNIVFDWRSVGDLTSAPEATLSGPTGTIIATSGQFPALRSAAVLVEDSGGTSVSATGSDNGSPGVTLDLSDVPSVPLLSPLDVHLGVAPISRGLSIKNEILGNSDATIVQQEFKLSRSPVTYSAGDSRSGDGYQSSIRAWVAGVEYHEVPTLNAQANGARVFATREDDAGFTYLKFASSLPTGVSNVVASYRIESGAASPDPGDISVITQPQAGIKKAVASTIVTPGSDPDPATRVRTLAPLSVLTFGRAVSGDDYETVAALAPGVMRARAYFGWDAATQRAAVKIYVGDTPAALTSARDAIGRASDPNRPAQILPAKPVSCFLRFSLLVDSDYVYTAVEAQVRSALLDPETGLFGASRLGIGESIFESEVMDACIDVPGVIAVHGLFFADQNNSSGSRYDPGEGGYYVLDDNSPLIFNGELYV
jgi:hypothetical protein